MPNDTTTLDRARLNARLDLEIEKDEPNLELVSDLVLLIAGDCNPKTTHDAMAAAAFRVFPFL